MNENNTNMSNNNYDYEVKKKSLFILILLLFLLVVLVIGVSYQIYLYSTTGQSLINEILGTGNDDIFSNGSVTVVYTEGENGSMTIENAIPMSDESGKKISDPNELMDFNVGININRSSAVSFEVVAEKDSNSTIENKNVKLYVQRGINKPTYDEEVLMPSNFSPIDKEDDYGAPEGVMVLDQVTTSESVTYYYRLRMWLDNKFVLDNTYKYFKIKVNVYGKGERIKGGSTNNNDNNDINNDNNSASDNDITNNNYGSGNSTTTSAGSTTTNPTNP